MNRYMLLTLAFVVVLALTAGCSGTSGMAAPAATPQAQAITDDTSLIEALRAAGAKVGSGDTIEQPFFPVPGKIIQINGQDVQVFVFADKAVAKAAAATVPANGSSFKTMMVDWMAPPHFFQRGRIIALYVGSDAAILQLLKTLLGEQFAGG